MDPDRWKQIDELLSAALQIDLDKRAAFLNEACLGDEELRKEVESLLAVDEKEANRIEVYPMQLAADYLTTHRTELIFGSSIGPYKILSMIGSGGMGEVYRATDSRIGRDVAVKVLPPHFSNDPDRLRRFEQEAHAAGMLNHPNIVAIYDIGTHNGSPYLVSELLQGQVLQQKLKGQRLLLRKAVDYALQIAKGLSAAHEKGIIHRDLKPANIFITKEGHVKILDFGLAKLTHPVESINQSPSEIADLTESGVVLGTVVYMSPEQVAGRKMDRRSDIFAFGSVLYEMLSGKRPFEGETQIEIMHAILKADLPELSLSNANIPTALERIVRRCLEKDPNHRFQSASDLAFALESLFSASGTPVVPINQKKPIQLAWILFGIFFLAATVLGVALYRSLNRTPQENSSSVQSLSIVLPENTVLNSSAISPDGQV
jgi:serine/threonine protein kinase